MSGAQEDMIGYAQELDITVASRPSSRPSSMERQTKLAHLKLVSKYYGYANFSYPRPDGTPTRNPYRRAGQTYSSEDLTQDYRHHGLACPETPTKRDRTSMGSQGSNSSAPSLIDDRTDSEVSLDDDYQYHASASQLWDTFWPIDEGKTQQTPEKAKTQYPALIPSPHIRRAKKTGCINYDAYPLPPRPVEYNIQVQHSPSPTPSTTVDPVTQPQPPASMPASPVPHSVQGPEDPEPRSPPELRRTIRAVRSSYSLFPRTQPQAPSYPPPPPPHFSALSTRPSMGNLRKGHRPPPIHLHSMPMSTATATAAPLYSPATASLFSPLSSPLYSPLPSDYTRPHTSHGNYYPCTADLTHPRSAPLPPQTPTIGTSSGLDTPKSFFDFDSDSDSDEEEPEHTISRFVKTLHKRTASETRRSAKGAAYADAQLRKIRAETEAERIRENQMIFERHKRSGAVFGRMFGRTHARSPNA
ncbi:hypothetical protein HER10_EVM0009377 [Colletotrichum scovillei]|uniref:Uncharacterized protein n=1 Tax=Colletotrichum scovillei TaxID=1209932 RepID=A0A9P7UCM0_9PEZI|nr:uncharacterized protein HER10_EVM0009377 [Colletotrichum scovillei]KAF4780101.1 hypothetical protein HER10_EVM0009377 [Colletotrichum scovillei]KAG7046927.1 hypothetical protein JMJ77_0015144 [Colletotrichum scovillei]KAG7056766.1 hypothetical protein JMJ78_0000556 [Colletotrichum scovillei]KAG7066691.1 hypothetical protein JMJ76_0000545 [Colletotrichum scovillei]